MGNFVKNFQLKAEIALSVVIFYKQEIKTT